MNKHEVKAVTVGHDKVEDTLNVLGSEGWELVSATFRDAEWRLAPDLGEMHSNPVLSVLPAPVWHCILKRTVSQKG